MEEGGTVASTLTISGAESSDTLLGIRRSEAAADGRELTASGTLTQLTVAGLSAGRCDTFRPTLGGDSGALCSTQMQIGRAESREPRAETGRPGRLRVCSLAARGLAAVLLAAFAALLALPLQAEAQTIVPNDTSDRPQEEWALVNADRSISRFLNEHVEARRSPGLFAAIIDETGVTAIATAGVRKKGSKTPLGVDDLVFIGSNAKAMTAVMLSSLVSEGVFPSGWQTSIAEVFPEFSGKIHAHYESVTLDQLVRMQGRIARMPPNVGAYGGYELKERRYKILGKSLKKRPAKAEGGFLYSNLSYMVAGTMAERLTGKTWEELMHERVFAPLGMTTVTFGPLGARGETNHPWGHRRSGSGRWKASRGDDPPAAGPAGSNLYMSMEDYAKFVRLWFLNAPPQILDRSQLDGLTTPGSGRYAAGWGVRQRSWGGGTVLSHGGSNRWWRVVLWAAPHRGRAYFAGANSKDKNTAKLLDSIVGNLIRHDLR